MINTLYVNGSRNNLSGLENKTIHLDVVQNGMIALSAVQTETLMLSLSKTSYH